MKFKDARNLCTKGGLIAVMAGKGLSLIKEIPDSEIVFTGKIYAADGKPFKCNYQNITIQQLKKLKSFQSIK